MQTEKKTMSLIIIIISSLLYIIWYADGPDPSNWEAQDHYLYPIYIFSFTSGCIGLTTRPHAGPIMASTTLT